MTIRLAKPGDETQLEKLINDCGLRNPSCDYSVWTDPVIVAEEGERLIGMIQAIVGQPISLLSLIAVRPEYEHQGIARALADAMDTLLREIGVKSYICIADPGNLRLHQSYANRGMSYVGANVQWMKVL